MNSLRPCKYSCTIPYHSPLYSNNSNKLAIGTINTIRFHRRNGTYNVGHAKKLVLVRAYNNANEEAEGGGAETERKGFLSLEEAGLVEISGLSAHERFLCRLTISSLNLLRVIAEQEKCSIEELNAGRVCDWFLKDKLKREQNIDSAVLQWDEDDPFQGQF